MDPFTHGIVGALIGKSFFAEDARAAAPRWNQPPATPGRVAILAATAGALFPDIDVFAAPFAHSNMAFITWHRNVSHSLLMLPLWALALTALTYYVARWAGWPSPPFGTLSAIYAVALASHLFLDLITSYGIMIWSPANYSRPAWDWVFIIDLTLTSAALLPQLAAWAFHRPKAAARRAIAVWAVFSAAALALVPLLRRAEVPYSTSAALGATAVCAMFLIFPLRREAGLRLGRARWARIGIALTASYIAFAGSLHHIALQQVERFAREARVPVLSLAALPMPPWPAFWAGMISTPGGVYRLEFSEFGAEPVTFRFFANSAPNRYIDAARNLKDAQTFLWFARFPLFQYLEKDGRHVVRISDLRFLGGGRRVPPPGETQTEVSRLSTFEVVFDPDGRVISAGSLRPN